MTTAPGASPVLVRKVRQNGFGCERESETTCAVWVEHRGEHELWRCWPWLLRYS